MTRNWRRGLFTALAAGATSIVACSSSCGTTLELTSQGGFAYVSSPDSKTVEIAMLKSTTGECTVPQLGAKLRVDDGRIVEPSGAGATFDPGGAVITFEGTGNNGVTLVGPGRPDTPRPDNPTTSDWHDLKWVPDTRPSYSSNPLNPNWRSMTDGRIVLTQGTLTAEPPSAPGAVVSTWKFKRTSDSTSFEQAITDKTHYSVHLSSNQVVINLVGARSSATPSRIVVEPLDKRRTVALTLIGTHDPNAPQIGVGDPLKDFCAFYELLLPVPPMSERLIPFFLGPYPQQTAPSTPPPGNGGSPGAYCPGDWP
ncbi:MAG TPA: hypothetical protein VNZ26_22705 [Vicinamibacterales bacterium]|jgi:hypothetical protein|nr:hypothetical protein [Vicinamibacterales bacterium]